MNRILIMHRLLAVSAIFLGLTFPISLSAEILHEERSVYRDITVEENDGRRCLVFNVLRGDRNQTCMDLDNPDRLVFTYTRMSFAGLLLTPSPKNILVAGLGGGTIPMIMNDMFPDAAIDIVEIDQAVINVAKDYFFFEENDNMKVVLNDARVFIKRSGILGKKYDYIILDAFGGDYIPEHLLTREFLEEVKQIMTPDAVLVANTFSTSRFYDHESVTYQQVFGEFFNFKLPSSGNRIIMTQLDPLPPRATLVSAARGIAPSLEKFGVPLLEYPRRLSTRVDWDMSRRVLTDQYAPANLLNEDR
jgi:spermidine synthase